MVVYASLSFWMKGLSQYALKILRLPARTSWQFWAICEVRINFLLSDSLVCPKSWPVPLKGALRWLVDDPPREREWSGATVIACRIWRLWKTSYWLIVILKQAQTPYTQLGSCVKKRHRYRRSSSSKKIFLRAEAFTSTTKPAIYEWCAIWALLKNSFAKVWVKQKKSLCIVPLRRLENIQ